MPLEPELPEILQDHRDAILGELHVAMPGRVQKYDAAKQVADIIPCVRGTIPDSDGNTILETLPVIPNVPVAWTRGGGFYMHFPLTAGDHVWLVFNSSAIAQWRATGEVSEPGDLRRSTLSYPFAIPAAAPDKQAFTDAPASGVGVIGVPGGGVLRVGGGGADFVALAALVTTELNKIKTHLSSLVVGAPGATGPAPMGAPVLSSSPYLVVGNVAATKLKGE